MSALGSRLRTLAGRGEGHKALPGQDGWLFLQADTNDVIGQHTGKVRMGRRRLAAWEALLRDRVALFEELGMTWRCVIAPDKEAVYAEQLPPHVVPAPRRPIHDLLDTARAVGAPLLYPLDELRAARGELPVYYATDTHWNQLGSYVAYELICKELGLPPLSHDEVDWIEELAVGDLGGKLDPPVQGPSVRAVVREQRGRLVADNRVENHGRVMAFETGDESLPSCVAFGESFGNHLLVFLKESFRRFVFVHTSMVDRVRLEEERPDVVLSLPVERFLIEVPDDRDAHRKLEETAARKIAAGRVRDGSDRFLRGIPTDLG